jgi:hypothetical protein
MNGIREPLALSLSKGGRLLFQQNPLLKYRPDAEEAFLRYRGVGQDLLAREGVADLVCTGDVLQVEGVRGGRHGLRVYLSQDVEVVQDLRELLLEPGDVILAEADTRQTGNVQDLFPGETQLTDALRDKLGWIIALAWGRVQANPGRRLPLQVPEQLLWRGELLDTAGVDVFLGLALRLLPLAGPEVGLVLVD